MDSDEQQIRELVQTWIDATKNGDVGTVLGLMTEDVLFLTPGRPPMNKADFAAQAHMQATPGALQIDGHSDPQEIQILGDWAFMVNKLTITVTPLDAEPVNRAGHTLTLFRKEEGRWLLARDANLLTRVEPGS